jgi:phospholipid/cholesterol/gamma-HCH transport system substrate-binding protein
MKISNESKVGILTIVALTLLILGFNFLKGKTLFTKSKKIYAVFDDLGSLEKSNEVKINGLPIGKVYDLAARDKNVNGIVITINLSKEVNIPDNSQAYISAPIVGSSYIIIEKGNSKTFLKLGDTLKTRVENGILGDFKTQMGPTLVEIKDAVDSLKTVLGKVNRMFDIEAKNNLQATIVNLKEASNALKVLLNNENSPLVSTLRNANSFAENLKKNNDSITAIISNAKKLTDKFSKLNLQQTLDSMNAALSEFKTTLAKVTSNNGTLGALINDKQLYNKINDAVLSAEILMDDIRAHPKRYVNISVFGKKDKTGPLTSPAKKDSLPPRDK